MVQQIESTQGFMANKAQKWVPPNSTKVLDKMPQSVEIEEIPVGKKWVVTGFKRVIKGKRNQESLVQNQYGVHRVDKWKRVFDRGKYCTSITNCLSFMISGRWIAGLPISKSEERKLKEFKFNTDRILPESLLREDDVFYETITSFVENGMGACNEESDNHVFRENVLALGDPFTLLDDMTNEGLCSVAEILTGGSVKLEKTRWKLKKIIKECFPRKFWSANDNQCVNIYEKLYPLLKDPRNFRRNHATLFTPFLSYHAAVIKILDGLDDLPTRSLIAMHRKLRGIKGYIPQLQPQKSGWGRDILIGCLRRSCMELLPKIGEGDELQEPLTKAMAVAGLTLKLILGCQFVTKFIKFSPEVEVLQNEIAKAIWLLKKKVRFPELKSLQLLLDPNVELTNRSLRIAIRNLLTDYLLECSDMETVPEWLPKTLAIINKSSRSAPFRYFSKKKIEEEVECILSVSAQIKQIMWDVFPEHGFDQYFSESYMEDLEDNMEDLEDSEDGDADKDDQQVEHLQRNKFIFNASYDEMPIESIGETNPTTSNSQSSMAKEDDCSPMVTPNSKLNLKTESMHTTKSIDGTEDQLGSKRNMGMTDSRSLQYVYSPQNSLCSNNVVKQEPISDSEKSRDFASNFSSREVNFTDNKQSMNRNAYLAVQEASDETSMIAYRLIGNMLDKFAQAEGLELDVDDTSYLRSYDTTQKRFQVARKMSSCDDDDSGSVLIQVVEELIPSFATSKKEKLKELICLR